MDVVRQLFRLILLGAINHQITHIVVRSGLFADLRAAAGRLHPKLGELMTCSLCFGTWVGFLEALVFRPGFVVRWPAGRAAGLARSVGLAPATGPLTSATPRPVRGLAALAADAFSIALAGRFFTEILAILASRAAAAKQREVILERQAERVAVG